MTDPAEDYTKWIGQAEVLEDDIESGSSPGGGCASKNKPSPLARSATVFHLSSTFPLIVFRTIPQLRSFGSVGSGRPRPRAMARSPASRTRIE